MAKKTAKAKPKGSGKKNPPRKQCPMCKMEVDAEAANCPGCNAAFDDSPVGATPAAAAVHQEEDPNANDNGGDENNDENGNDNGDENGDDNNEEENGDENGDDDNGEEEDEEESEEATA